MGPHCRSHTYYAPRRNAEAQRAVPSVVDVDAGECVFIRAPGPDGFRYMVYDTGNFVDSETTAIDAVREIIPRASAIELLVVSHSDPDRLAAVPTIVREYQVKRIVPSGMRWDTDAWILSAAIKRATGVAGGR